MQGLLFQQKVAAMLFRPQQSKLCMEALFDAHYQPVANLARRSEKRYRSEVRRWDRLTGSPQIGRIQTEHFAMFRRGCQLDGLTHCSIEGTVKIVRSMLRYAARRKWIRDPPDTGRPLRIEAPEPLPATNQELNALWHAMTSATYPQHGTMPPETWWRDWTTVDWFTALRLDDSLHLAAEHVRFSQGIIRFKASKTAKTHTYPLTEPITSVLEELVRYGQPTFFGSPEQNKLRRELARLCEIAGIRKLTPKQIRQFGITSWLSAGEAAGKLVHGTGLPRVLNHYIGVAEVLKEALPRLEWPECFLERMGRQRRLF